MKQIVIVFIILGVFLLLTSERNLSWCKKLIGAEANMDEYEYFGKLSEYYYGTTDYWKELSLVNNATNPLAENELIVPTLKAVQKLKNEQSLEMAHVMSYD